MLIYFLVSGVVTTEGMVGEVAEGTEETGTALPHLVTDSVPAEVAVTIMTVGMYPAWELHHSSSHFQTKSIHVEAS